MKLKTPLRPFTTTEPSIARVWDFLLGGKDNFAVDRNQADKLLSVFPRAAELARQSRQFQARAVTYAAEPRYPAVPRSGRWLRHGAMTHETAQDVEPEALMSTPTTTSKC